MLHYCESCKSKFGLNNRIFQLFSKQCDICNKLVPIVNICSISEIDKQMNIIIWQQPIDIIYANGRKNTILIKKFCKYKESENNND